MLRGDKMSDKLQQAVALIKAGRKQEGGQLLTQIVQQDPNNEMAWLWMATIVVKDQQRIHCLTQVLRINPNNQTARKGLASLKQKQVASSQPKPATPPQGVPQTASAGLLNKLAQPIQPSPPTQPTQSAQPAQPIQTQQAIVESKSQYNTSEDYYEEDYEEDYEDEDDYLADIDMGGLSLDEDDEEIKALIDYVVGELGKHMSHNDIIPVVCETRNISWKQAEAFVKVVEEKNKNKIARRQAPLLIGIGIFMVLAGTVTTFDALLDILDFIIDPVMYTLENGDIIESLGKTIAELVLGVTMLMGGGFGTWWAIRDAAKK